MSLNQSVQQSVFKLCESLSLSGPADRRAQYVQCYEELCCLQTACRPGLPAAAAAAVAVVQQLADSLFAGRFVASLLHSNKLQRTDKHTFV